MTLSFIDPLGRGRDLLERLASAGDDDAHGLLAWLDEQEDSEAYLDELGEKLGDFDEAEGRLKLLERIEDEADANDCLNEMPGDDLSEQVEALCRGYERYESQSFALSDLAIEAGLLKPNDYTTDPLPLIRMFLPV